MGKGGNSNDNSELRVLPWDEVEKHVTWKDRWIVINGGVYDVSSWQKKHPGGARIISHFSGQDATDAFRAMHPNIKYATKFMKPLLVGQIEEPDKESKDVQMMLDFRALRSSLEERGMFEASPIFYTLQLAHILLLEALAYFLLINSDGGPIPFFTTAVLLTIAQAQAGWTQHDYGHLSVFRSSKINHFFHHITIGVFKSASSHWWNFRHSQHHVKPNVYDKDPDITLSRVFLLGDKIPVEWGAKKRGSLPYQYQHLYFWLVGPLTLIPIVFHLENLYFVFKRRDWIDLLTMVIFYAHFDYLFAGYYGSRWTAAALYFATQTMESFWFTFVTQMNHIPMDVDVDQNRPWLAQQTIASCNIEPSLFNDWFTGHLNYQIEHHLFPTMPRHNLAKVSTEVKALCKKYDQPYVIKPLSTAFADIPRALKESGNIWYEAYNRKPVSKTE